MSDLRRIAIRVLPEEAEEARAELLEFAAHGFEERDLPGKLELAVYGSAEVESALRGAAQRGAFGKNVEVSSERVEPGWEDRWRAFHRPVEIGLLWVGPPWEPACEGLVPVVIDPGRAFGTGAHPTTRLCLELLQELGAGSGASASLLDAGCGSGVLAIAAAKLGFEPVIAIDNDPEAIEAAELNANANGVAVDIRLTDAVAHTDTDPQPLPQVDVVVCNISLPVLEALASRLDCEALVASGFLSTERPRIGLYEPIEWRVQGDWAACLARRTVRA